MKHIRMFDNAEQAETVLSVLEYITLSAVRGESIVTLKPEVIPDPEATPFYITNDDTKEITVTIRKYGGSAPTIALQVSDDGDTWTDLGSTSTTALNITLGVGARKYIRSVTDSAWGNLSAYNGFRSAGLFGAHGNIMTLLGYDTLKGYDCIQMFKGTSLITAPALPATTLAQYCYSNMFQNCTALTTAPTLPATTLTNFCYNNMFQNCTALTTAPATLPATTLATSCYQNMFQGCTSLRTAPELPAMTLAQSCYGNMFQNCTSLTTAPELPATTLVNSCYYGMFQGCTALATAPALPATTLANYCYNTMFRGCASLTTAPVLPAMTLADNCYTTMFMNCSSLTTAPDLPATTLADSCYTSMFKGCTNLNYIKCLATDISATNCTNNWVDSVASTGTFVKNPNMSSWTTGANGIPSGWTVEDA